MALVHILDRQTDKILDTLNSNKGEYWEPNRHDSLNAENTFDLIVNATLEKASLLEKLNRLLIQDEDGMFREYIIQYSEQNKRNQRMVNSDASFIGLKRAKVINPQTFTGTTAQIMVEFALSGTEWKPGVVEFTTTNTIDISSRTNPYDLLKLVADVFGLEISFRIEVNGNDIVGRYVDFKINTVGFDGKEIEFGKDLIGITRKEDSSKIVTALLGVHTKSDGTEITAWVENEDALQRWGRKGQHLVDWYSPEVNDDNMTESQLKVLTENELKKRIDSIVSYGGEAASIEHVFSREHEKIRVGQIVRIKDIGYNPPLYVEARIQELDRNYITKAIKGYKIGNYTQFKKTDLEKQIANLKSVINDKIVKMVTTSVESSAGDVFKNGLGSTTLTAKVYLSGSETDLDGTRYSYNWSSKDKDGLIINASVSTNKSITVSASEINDKSTYVAEISGNGVSISSEFTITVVNDGTQGLPGEDAWHVEIISSNGNIFKAGKIQTTLSARVYKGSDDITYDVPSSKFRWTRVSSDAVSDQNWNDRYFGGTRSVDVTTEDVYQRATFFCEILD